MDRSALVPTIKPFSREAPQPPPARSSSPHILSPSHQSPATSLEFSPHPTPTLESLRWYASLLGGRVRGRVAALSECCAHGPAERAGGRERDAQGDGGAAQARQGEPARARPSEGRAWAREEHARGRALAGPRTRRRSTEARLCAPRRTPTSCGSSSRTCGRPSARGGGRGAKGRRLLARARARRGRTQTTASDFWSVLPSVR